MLTTEDEKPRKPKATRAPRAKKVATAVTAAILPDATTQPTLQYGSASSNALEMAVNRASSDIAGASDAVAPQAVAPADIAPIVETPPQPHGANLSSYAPAAASNPAASNSAASNAANQLSPTQRPKISPLSPPAAPPAGSPAVPSLMQTPQTPQAAPSISAAASFLPSSLLNTPQESAASASIDADNLAQFKSARDDAVTPLDQPKAVKLSSDKNNPSQRDLRLVGTAQTGAQSAGKANPNVSVNTKAALPSADMQPTKTVPPSHHSGQQPGVMLRQAREARGLSVADVANRLRMGNRQVTALEAGQFEELPEGTFLRGFARNFSKVVGADTDAVLAALEAVNPDAAAPSTGIAPPVQNMQFSQHRQAPSRFSPKIGLLVLVAVALSGAAWYWFEHVRSAPVAGSAGAATGLSTMPITPATPTAASATNLAGAQDAAAVSDGSTKAADTATEPATAIGVVATPLTPLTPLAPPTTPPMAAPSGTSGVAIPVPSAAATVPALAPSAVAVPNSAAPNSPVSVDRLIDKNKFASTTTTPAAAPGVAVTAPAVAPSPAREVPKPGNSTLSFVFTDASWVEVADARGNLIVNRTFKKGDTHQVEGRTPFSIVVGNSKNATMQYNGAPFDLAPHTKVSVARLRLK